jgi:hypothetical protein
MVGLPSHIPPSALALDTLLPLRMMTLLLMTVMAQPPPGAYSTCISVKPTSALQIEFKYSSIVENSFVYLTE